MRQGEVSSKGAWIGDPLGGVTAPDPILIPDRRRRFARSAARLDALAEASAMKDWLRFMAALARAQQASLDVSPACEPDLAALEQAAAARMPPLAIDGHRRDPWWRDGLDSLLDALTAQPIPAAARQAALWLRRGGAGAAEALADDFVHGAVVAEDAGPALFVAAALQVYFVALASALPAQELRLLSQRGLCPCCGSTPSAGLVTASGKTPGARYLYCSLCGTGWNYVRALCISCGESRSTTVRGVEGEDVVKAETCDECGAYSKLIYQAKDMDADPYADDLATLGLDLMVSEAGWARHAPNPLLLTGSAGG